MANREKGEASFECDGRRYTLVLNMYAWAETQDVLAARGRKVQDEAEIGRLMTEGRRKYIIAMLYGMLQEHHPEIETLAQASALLETAGVAAVQAMGLAFGLAPADVEDVKELTPKSAAGPPPAQAEKRTGGRSTSRLARTA